MTTNFSETYNELTIKCDYSGCKDSQLQQGNNFRTAIVRLQQKGWLVTKIDDEWCHFCGICKHYV